MKTISIRWYLVFLAGVVAIPMMFFVILLLTQLNLSEQEALERRTGREASNIASAVYLILKDMDSTLELVASAPDLETGDLEEFHYRTQRALQSSGKFVVVVDAEGQQLLNTRVPYGEPLGRMSDMATLTHALESGETVISDVFFGKTSGKWVFNMIMPLPKSKATTARALIITRNASELMQVLGSPDLPEGWNLAVVDRSGTLIAGRGESGVEPGEFLELHSGIAELNYYGTTTDDASQTLLGYAQIPLSGWFAFTWGPIETAKSSILANWHILLAGGAIMLFLFLTVSVYAADRLRQAVTGLARMAHLLGEGEIVSPQRSRIREIDVVATALSEASFDRSEAETQLNTVMGELAHRTKNLMTVLISMIRQTARNSGDVETMKTALEGRVMALDASVNLLTRSASRSVSMRELVQTQTSTFAQSKGSVRIDGIDLDIKADAAQQLGMALHELSTNAVKYGALSSNTGQVTVSWTIVEAEAENPVLDLRWQESGGPPVAEPDRQGFGQAVIKDHSAAVFRGQVTLTYDPAGFFWSLRAPLDRFVDSKPQRSDEVSGRSRHGAKD